MIVYWVQFSREDSHSAELEGRKGLEKKVFPLILTEVMIWVTICFMSDSSVQISGSSTDSVDSLYKSIHRQFSRVSSTTSSQSFDEDTGHKISKSNLYKLYGSRYLYSKHAATNEAYSLCCFTQVQNQP